MARPGPVTVTIHLDPTRTSAPQMHETIPLTNALTLVLFTQTPTEQTRHQHRLLNVASLCGEKFNKRRASQVQSPWHRHAIGARIQQPSNSSKQARKSLLTNGSSRKSYRRPSPFVQPSPPNAASPLRAFSTPHSPLCAHRLSPSHAPLACIHRHWMSAARRLFSLFS
jgi:hypothetical protein